MTRVVGPSVAVAVALGAGAAGAGNTRATPPVNVVVPTSPAGYPDDLPGPQAELARAPRTLALPAVPAFDLPVAEPGLRDPRELRVRGRALVGTAVQVRGYVTWIYDCAAELARTNRDASAAEIAESIDHQPGLCDGPMFSLGDAKSTPRERSIWVVDVPRPPNKAERAQRSRAELAAWPAVPRLAVGDHVLVTGTWAIESPSGERNAGGLLVYRGVERHAPGPTSRATVPALAGLPDIAVVTDVPLRPIVETRIRNASITQLNDCNRALAAKQFEVAITLCRAAIATWGDNHLAWYGWASAHLARSEWRDALTAIERAVALRPDVAMYQLYQGLARYEAERQHARDRDSRTRQPAPATPPVAPSVDPLTDARDALLRAVKLSPELWRARYYLGLALRDTDEPRRAAEQLSEAIAMHPGFRPSYLALIELYRRWGYIDQAITVATLGTAQVTTDAAELWFELAMAYEAKHADAQALAALDTALASRPDDPSVLLQRGRILLRKGDPARARRDLERAARATDPRTVVVRRLASQLLAQLDSRTQADAARRTSPGTRRYKRVYRPSEEPYEPWTMEDAKFRM